MGMGLIRVQNKCIAMLERGKRPAEAIVTEAL
jgi:hypothetical protein